MINNQLLNPRSIVVVGGSDDVQKPGGKILKNIIDGRFAGALYVTNLKNEFVQGVKAYQGVSDLPKMVDLAIIAVAAKYCLSTIEILAREKGVRAFVIISAGFSEESEQGAEWERQIVKVVNEVNGCLIGPNCIGVLTVNHHSVFTTPIPVLEPRGADFISGSGATAVFIIEAGVSRGLKFNSVYSVGNSAQTGVEDVLEYLDQSFDPNTSSRVKLLYMEGVSQPAKLLKHALSLRQKGCWIAAIKAGNTEAGSRAASSHTGALASSDLAVDVLFRKAGIVRCYGREELANVAAVFMGKALNGKNIAVITHAGGPAVMLTDALSKGGFVVPPIEGSKAQALLGKLYDGSSVANPIDFLATGTHEQLGAIIDACENDFDHIDAMVVIFGSPGLFPVKAVYDVLNSKMKWCKKPIYPVLPSVVNAGDEIRYFLSLGNTNFSDEVQFAMALAKVYGSAESNGGSFENMVVDAVRVRRLIDKQTNGYLLPDAVQALMDAAGIPRVQELVSDSLTEMRIGAAKLGYPLVMKVVGPLHKSDVGGVVLNVQNEETLISEFERMMRIDGAVAVMAQPMISGMELFVGAKYEPGFGHVILCGLGGIFVEVLKDISSGLSPLNNQEALQMIRRLKGYGVIKGVRGQQGISENKFAEVMVRLSLMLELCPEIKELDINPLLGKGEQVVAVDARIRIEK